MHRRKIGRDTFAGCKARFAIGGVKPVSRLREYCFYLARIALIAIIVVLGQLPIRAAEGKLSPTFESDVTAVAYDQPDLQHFLDSSPTRPVLTVEIVESAYEEKIRLEAEAARPKPLATKGSKKLLPVQPQLNGSVSKPSQPKSTVGTFCSCVLFAEALTGKNPGIIGFAKNWPINSHIPTVGAIGITNESSAGHVFVVTAVDGANIEVTEANKTHCIVTSRTLPINSPFIRGYYQ